MATTGIIPIPITSKNKKSATCSRSHFTLFKRMFSTGIVENTLQR